MRKIIDEFTHLNVSRQRKWSLRRKRDGLCTICGEPSVTAMYCLKHSVYARDYQRKYHGAWRKFDCLTRRLEKEVKKSVDR